MGNKHLYFLAYHPLGFCKQDKVGFLIVFSYFPVPFISLIKSIISKRLLIFLKASFSSLGSLVLYKTPLFVNSKASISLYASPINSESCGDIFNILQRAFIS